MLPYSAMNTIIVLSKDAGSLGQKYYQFENTNISHVAKHCLSERNRFLKYSVMRIAVLAIRVLLVKACSQQKKKCEFLPFSSSSLLSRAVVVFIKLGAVLKMQGHSCF